jgi:hypothetical protein
LLVFAHLTWNNHKTTSYITDRIAPLLSYENDAIEYKSEMCRNSCLIRSSRMWKSLISKSLIFPYLGNCYLIPCRLIWASSTPTSRQVGDFTKTRVGIAKSCRSLIPNFDINNLFVSYDKLRQLNLYKLGFCYESLFASSLAVKYYLRKLEMKNRQLLPLLEMYNIGNEDPGSRDSISDLLVDFLWG